MFRRYSLLLLGLSLAATSYAQCAVIDFEGLPSRTTVTDTYQNCGVVFSSNGEPLPPATHDYGIGSYTSVLHSYDWYAPLRFDFVEPLDGVTPRPVAWFSFDNPVDSEEDIINGIAYDALGNVLQTFSSTSSDNVYVDAGAPVIAYVLLDDNDFTAYVIDNLIFAVDGGSTSINTEATLAFELLGTLVPGPLSIASPTPMTATVVAQDGRVVRQFDLLAGTHQYATDDLATGTYIVVAATEHERHCARFVKQ